MGWIEEILSDALVETKSFMEWIDGLSDYDYGIFISASRDRKKYLKLIHYPSLN